MRLLLTCICAAALTLAACKKSDDPDVLPPPSGDVELTRITASEWKVYRVDLNNLNVYDLLLEDCQKDDTYRFYKDSTLLHYENSSVCSGMPDSSATQWQFYNGKSQLIGTILGITDTVDVVSILATEMKLAVNYQGNPAVIYFKKP